MTARVEAMRASIAAAASTETTAARAEVDTLKGTLSKREAQLLKLTKDGVMRAELDRVKPLDDAVDALMLMAGQSISMVKVDGELTARVVDKAGNQRLNASGDPMSIRAFMRENAGSAAVTIQARQRHEGHGDRRHRSSSRRPRLRLPTIRSRRDPASTSRGRSRCSPVTPRGRPVSRLRRPDE